MKYQISVVSDELRYTVINCIKSGREIEKKKASKMAYIERSKNVIST